MSHGTDTLSTFLDRDGFVRTPNRWGFNSFADAEEAKASCRRYAVPHSTWYLFRLADGTFHTSALRDPTGYPCELVEVFTTPE